MGMRRVFLGIFLALGFSLFDGEPALLSTAATDNASRYFSTGWGVILPSGGIRVQWSKG